MRGAQRFACASLLALSFVTLVIFAALGRITAAPSQLALAEGPHFRATLLTDFHPGQLYLGTFPGLLYSGSNNPPPDHDEDGRAFAAKIVPIDGKIVVIGIGMSNWTDELCTGTKPPIPPNCTSNSFFAAAAADPSVNHSDLALVDCAQGGHDASQWVDDSFKSYTVCNNRLAAQGLTPDQVEVILWKNGDIRPTVSLSSSTVCSPTSPVDACRYEKFSGEMARFAKRWYRNTQQLFVHSRIYAGYALTSLNPEPFAYEYGFATKWLVNAQIVQIRTGRIDPTAGDLGYDVAPWIAWGPYFWANPQERWLGVAATRLRSQGPDPSWARWRYQGRGPDDVLVSVVSIHAMVPTFGAVIQVPRSEVRMFGVAAHAL